MNMAAIIVAAGRSSRMKAFKPLLPLQRHTIIETAVATLREVGVGRIIVVTGRQAQDLRHALAAEDVSFVHNDAYATSDMFTSVKLGLAQLAAGPATDAAFLLPADVPLFRADTLTAMGAALVGAGAVVPLHLGFSGHPVLLAGRVLPAVAAYGGDGGLRGAIAALPNVVRLPVADFGILPDADTPADYHLLRLLCGEVPGIPAGEALTWEALPPEVTRHEAAVARRAVLLGMTLNENGCRLDLWELEKSALLHDIACAQPHHAKAGARLLHQLGQPGLAGIVRQHRQPDKDHREGISAATTLFLADKHTLGEALVTLDKRFGNDVYPPIDEATREKTRKRRRIAEQVERQFSTLLGESVYSLLHRSES